MIAISALLALTLVQAQEGSGVTSLAGRVVRIDYPTAPIAQLPGDVKGWAGFKYADAGSRDWPNVFLTPGDWKPIGDKVAALGAAPAPVIWRTKVLIVTQADVLTPDADGLFRQDRSQLDQTQLNALLTALARFAGWVKAETNGQISLSLDVSIDTEVARRSAGDFQYDFLKEYAEPRFNGGKYEADDKVYRGPYNSAFVIHPGLVRSWMTTRINETPISSISFYKDWTGADGSAATGLEPLLMEGLLDQIAMRRTTLGMALPSQSIGSLADGTRSLRGLMEPDDYADYAALEDLPVEHLARLLKRPVDSSASAWDSTTPAYRLAPYAPTVTLSTETDPEKGSVLKYSEKAPIRVGGFVLPNGKVDLGQTPWLKFWAKSTGRDRLSVFTTDGKKDSEFALGGFVPDGKWHEVSVDLSKVAKPTAIYLAPPDAVNHREKLAPGLVEYEFADFRFEAQGQAGAVVEDEEFKRAASAVGMTAAELVKDSSDVVRLNGLLKHEAAYAATDEAALIELAHDANMRVVAAAISQLGKLGTPTAKKEILRLVTASPFEGTKQAASLEVGKMGDGRMAGALSLAFASKNWQTRMAGAQAIAMLPGDEASVVLMTFLQETDPEIRVAVTKAANIANSVVVKRLLWSEVNDPSDSVRANSALRLIFSGQPKASAEGYKAVRDDSVGVRLAVLKGLFDKPDEAHRGALRIAVTDISPRVRAAALRAFGKLKDVNLDEIANTLEDKYPEVQIALIELAKAKNLTLPKNAVDGLRASIDPHVVEMAKELGS